ncbi:MAG: O-antigen ligase family protein [Paracoccaceae bacterium]|nr:O-antigen ligase family protein [Paracoccaceae bacterium]
MVEYAVRRSPPLSLAQGAIGWATLAVVLVLVVFYGGNAPVYWTLLAVLVIPLFSAQLLLGLIRGMPTHAPRLVAPALFYFAALAWGLLQTLDILPSAWGHPFWGSVPGDTATVSATPAAGQHTVLRFATYAMVFWIAAQAAINATRALAFLKGFAIFSLGLAAFGLWAVVSGVNPVLGEQATSNVSATFINRNSYATYAAFGLVANLGVYLHLVRARGAEGDSRHRALRTLIERFFSGAWVFALGAAVCLSALLLTASRAGVAAGLVGLVVLVIVFRRDRRRASAVWLSLLVLLGAFATALSENVFSRIVATDSDLRFVVYREMLANLDARLLLGHGLGAFQDTFRPLVPLEAAATDWTRAHSSYLENLWELGLPAALAFYIALAWVAAVLLRGSLIRRRNRLYPIVAMVFVVIGGAHSLVDFSLQMPAAAALFAFVLGIGWAHAWPKGVREG